MICYAIVKAKPDSGLQIGFEDASGQPIDISDDLEIAPHGETEGAYRIGPFYAVLKSHSDGQLGPL